VPTLIEPNVVCLSVCLCVGVCGSQTVKLVATSAGPEAGVGVLALLTDDNKWGLVCDDWWDDNAARLVCTCLGYNRSVSCSLCLSVCLSVTLLGLQRLDHCNCIVLPVPQSELPAHISQFLSFSAILPHTSVHFSRSIRVNGIIEARPVCVCVCVQVEGVVQHSARVYTTSRLRPVAVQCEREFIGRVSCDNETKLYCLAHYGMC